MSFAEDLHIGHTTEQEVLEHIQTKYPNAYKKDGYFKEYDIYIPEINKSVEVKQDYKSAHTGNLVVELTFNGKPSALLTTKADYWVFVLKNQYIWTSPERIKQAIGTYGKDPARFKGKGDSVYKLAWLIPIHYIENTAMTTIAK